MPTPYELPSIMLRNSRYRGHRESEKRLSSHNEQVYDIHRLNHQLKVQSQQIDEITNEWFEGVLEEIEVIHTINEVRSFPASASQTLYQVINDYELRNVNSVVVKLNHTTISSSDYAVVHGSIYIDLESVVGMLPPSATLQVTMNADIVQRGLGNKGIHKITQSLRNMDGRLKEAERKYLKYEDAYK